MQEVRAEVHDRGGTGGGTSGRCAELVVTGHQARAGSRRRLRPRRRARPCAPRGETAAVSSSNHDDEPIPLPRPGSAKPLTEAQKKSIAKRADKIEKSKPFRSNAAFGVSFGTVLAIALFGWRVQRALTKAERIDKRNQAIQTAPEEVVRPQGPRRRDRPGRHGHDRQQRHRRGATNGSTRRSTPIMKWPSSPTRWHARSLTDSTSAGPARSTSSPRSHFVIRCSHLDSPSSFRAMLPAANNPSTGRRSFQIKIGFKTTVKSTCCSAKNEFQVRADPHGFSCSPFKTMKINKSTFVRLVLLLGLLAVFYLILFPFLPPSPTATARSAAIRTCKDRGWPLNLQPRRYLDSSSWFQQQLLQEFQVVGTEPFTSLWVEVRRSILDPTWRLVRTVNEEVEVEPDYSAP